VKEIEMLKQKPPALFLIRARLESGNKYGRQLAKDRRALEAAEAEICRLQGDIARLRGMMAEAATDYQRRDDWMELFSEDYIREAEKVG
jgi:hypothetical protein